MVVSRGGCVALYRGVPRWLCQGVDGLLYIGVYPDGCAKRWMGCCVALCRGVPR